MNKAIHFNSETGKTKTYESLLKYMRYNSFANYLSNAHFVSSIHLTKRTEGRCIVKCYVPNGHIEQEWASYEVAHEYFTKRSYIFRNIPLIIYEFD